MDAIFISHASRDDDLARLFERHLRRRIHTSTVWNSTNLPVGVNWREEIDRRMVSANAFLALITESYLASTNAMLELGRLIEIHARTVIPLIPIVVDPVRLTDTPVSEFLGFSLPRILTDESNHVIDRLCAAVFDAITRWRNLRFPVGSGELYLRYRLLRPKTLADVLSAIAHLHARIYRIATDAKLDITDEALFSQAPVDLLQIASLETGESIRLRLKTGWLPSFDVEEGDLVIEIPRGALCLVATLMILSVSIDKGTSHIKDVLDIIKSRNEIEMQELQKDKLHLEIEALMQKLANSGENQQSAMQKDIRRFLESTVENSDVLSVRVTTRDSVTQK